MYAQKYHLKLYANFLEPLEKVKAKNLQGNLFLRSQEVMAP